MEISGGVPMNKPMRVQEFANQTGVSVRALHHYDRLGLLRPVRNGAGYRFYGVRELERLEQIVALKLIGIPLKQIKVLLDRKSSGMREELLMQRTVLEEKRHLLDRAIQAIEQAERSIAEDGTPDAAILKKIIEVIAMQNNTNWSEKYYDPAAKAAIQQRAATFTPEDQARVQAEWTQLFREVEAVLDDDPAGETAQALGKRWKALVGQFTGGNPAVAKGLNRMYADRPNWPAEAKGQMAAFSNLEVWAFMGRVLQCEGIA
jgi:DNA-binding transcriptional MerR regulator